MIRKGVHHEDSESAASRFLGLVRVGPRLAFSLGAAYFCVSLAAGARRQRNTMCLRRVAIRILDPGVAFATLQKANNSAAAGDTIWMRAGPTPSRASSRFRRAEPRTPTAPRFGRIGRGAHSRHLELRSGQLGLGRSRRPCDRGAGCISRDSRSPMPRSGPVAPLLLHAAPQECNNNTLRVLNIHNGSGQGYSSTRAPAALILITIRPTLRLTAVRGMGKNGRRLGVHYKPLVLAPSSAGVAHGTIR